MDRVPLEIVSAIAKSFNTNFPNEQDWPLPTVSDPADIQALAALSQTSKSIHTITLPALFRTVSLIDSSSYADEATKHDRFLNTLLNNPSIAKHVKRLALRSYIETSSLEGTDRPIHALINADDVPEKTKMRLASYLVATEPQERNGAIYLLHLLDNLDLLELTIPNSIRGLASFENSLEPSVCVENGGMPLSNLKELRLVNRAGIRNACQLWRLITSPNLEKVRLLGFAWSKTTIPGFSFDMNTCNVPFLDIQAGNISHPELSEIFDRFIKLRHLSIEFDGLLAPLNDKTQLGDVFREKGGNLEHLSLDMLRQNNEAGIDKMLRDHWSFSYGSFGSLTTLTSLKHLRINRRDLLGINGEKPRQTDHSQPSSLSQALPASLETLFLYAHERHGFAIRGLKHEQGHVNECYELMRSSSFPHLREIKFELRAKAKFRILRNRVPGWTITMAEELVERNMGVDEDEELPCHNVITMRKI